MGDDVKWNAALPKATTPRNPFDEDEDEDVPDSSVDPATQLKILRPFLDRGFEVGKAEQFIFPVAGTWYYQFCLYIGYSSDFDITGETLGEFPRPVEISPKEDKNVFVIEPVWKNIVEWYCIAPSYPLARFKRQYYDEKIGIRNSYLPDFLLVTVQKVAMGDTAGQGLQRIHVLRKEGLGFIQSQIRHLYGIQPKVNTRLWLKCKECPCGISCYEPPTKEHTSCDYQVIHKNLTSLMEPIGSLLHNTDDVKESIAEPDFLHCLSRQAIRSVYKKMVGSSKIQVAKHFVLILEVQAPDYRWPMRLSDGYHPPNPYHEYDILMGRHTLSSSKTSPSTWDYQVGDVLKFAFDANTESMRKSYDTVFKGITSIVRDEEQRLIKLKQEVDATALRNKEDLKKADDIQTQWEEKERSFARRERDLREREESLSKERERLDKDIKSIVF